jgi:hypothetical protein
VAPKVFGYLAEVLVSDIERAKAKQPLARINGRDFVAALTKPKPTSPPPSRPSDTATRRSNSSIVRRHLKAVRVVRRCGIIFASIANGLQLRQVVIFHEVAATMSKLPKTGHHGNVVDARAPLCRLSCHR